MSYFTSLMSSNHHLQLQHMSQPRALGFDQPQDAHLLPSNHTSPSQPPTDLPAGGSTVPSISDFKFTVIGQQPSLLGRLATPDPETYHDNRGRSPTSSPDLEDQLLPHEDAPADTKVPSLMSLLDRLTGSLRNTSPHSSDVIMADSTPQPSRMPSRTFPASTSDTPSTSNREQPVPDSFTETHMNPSQIREISTSITYNEARTIVNGTTGAPRTITPDLSQGVDGQNVNALVPKFISASSFVPQAATLTNNRVLSTTASLEQLGEVADHITFRAFQARLLSSLSTIDPPNTTRARLLVHSANAQVASALNSARHCYSVVQQSFLSAQESMKAAEQCLRTAEQAKLRADEAVAAVEQVGKSESEGQSRLLDIKAELQAFGEWVNQREAQEAAEIERREKQFIDGTAIAQPPRSEISLRQSVCNSVSKGSNIYDNSTNQLDAVQLEDEEQKCLAQLERLRSRRLQIEEEKRKRREEELKKEREELRIQQERKDAEQKCIMELEEKQRAELAKQARKERELKEQREREERTKQEQEERTKQEQEERTKQEEDRQRKAKEETREATLRREQAERREKVQEDKRRSHGETAAVIREKRLQEERLLAQTVQASQTSTASSGPPTSLAATFHSQSAPTPSSHIPEFRNLTLKGILTSASPENSKGKAISREAKLDGSEPRPGHVSASSPGTGPSSQSTPTVSQGPPLPKRSAHRAAGVAPNVQAGRDISLGTNSTQATNNEPSMNGTMAKVETNSRQHLAQTQNTTVTLRDDAGPSGTNASRLTSLPPVAHLENSIEIPSLTTSISCHEGISVHRRGSDSGNIPFIPPDQLPVVSPETQSMNLRFVMEANGVYASSSKGTQIKSEPSPTEAPFLGSPEPSTMKESNIPPRVQRAFGTNGVKMESPPALPFMILTSDNPTVTSSSSAARVTAQAPKRKSPHDFDNSNATASTSLNSTNQDDRNGSKKQKKDHPFDPKLAVKPVAWPSTSAKELASIPMSETHSVVGAMTSAFSINEQEHYQLTPPRMGPDLIHDDGGWNASSRPASEVDVVEREVRRRSHSRTSKRGGRAGGQGGRQALGDHYSPSFSPPPRYRAYPPTSPTRHRPYGTTPPREDIGRSETPNHYTNHPMYYEPRDDYGAYSDNFRQRYHGDNSPSPAPPAARAWSNQKAWGEPQIDNQREREHQRVVSARRTPEMYMRSPSPVILPRNPLASRIASQPFSKGRGNNHPSGSADTYPNDDWRRYTKRPRPPSPRQYQHRPQDKNQQDASNAGPPGLLGRLSDPSQLAKANNRYPRGGKSRGGRSVGQPTLADRLNTGPN